MKVYQRVPGSGLPLLAELPDPTKDAFETIKELQPIEINGKQYLIMSKSWHFSPYRDAYKYELSVMTQEDYDKVMGQHQVDVELCRTYLDRSYVSICKDILKATGKLPSYEDQAYMLAAAAKKDKGEKDGK